MNTHVKTPGFGPDVITASDLVAMDIPPRECLLEPWLAKSELAMVYAARGVGKTHFAMGVAHAVATGGDFLGWKAPSPQPVLYVDGEMTLTTLKERLVPLVAGITHPGNFRIAASDLLSDGIPDIGTEAGQIWLRNQIGNAQLVVLDNLSCLYPSAHENEVESWKPMQRFLLRLRREGRSVLLVHHTGKNGLQRGSAGREDILNTVIRLSHPAGYKEGQGARFVVQYEKTRADLGEGAGEIEARLDRQTGVWMCGPPTHPKLPEILRLLDDGLTQTQIAERLDIHKSNVSRILSAAGAAGLIPEQAEPAA